MSTITLDYLLIDNVKGIKHKRIEFSPFRTVLKGENGSGKTTVYDTLLWLVHGKDSAGRKDFELRPLDSDNQPIRGLTVAAEAGMTFDGVQHILRKEQREKKTKGIMGYETLCWIDEVPKKVGEYAEWIAERVPEDTFKMLTDLRAFSEKLHWTERREVLLGIAGPIGEPRGFDELLGLLKGRKVDEYKEVFQEQKKRLIKERDEINPRIDELQRGCDAFVAVDKSDIESQRTAAKSELETVLADRKKVNEAESERQRDIAAVNGLKQKQIGRERELANDTSGVESLLDEKRTIDSKLFAHTSKLSSAMTAVTQHQGKIALAKQALATAQSDLASVRSEYEQASKSPVDGTCTACGQALPADKLKVIEEKRQARLSGLVQKGNTAKVAVKTAADKVTELEIALTPLKEAVEQLEIQQKEGQDYKAQRFAQIDDMLKARPKAKPEADGRWKALQEEIEAMEKRIGKAAHEQLAALDKRADEIRTSLAQFDKALAAADRNAQDTARIKELADSEIKLSQQISDTEKRIDELGRYQARQSAMVEEAVNGRFKHVKFKLFRTLLNEGVEPCCEATLNGVPYSDCSYGQKILIGIDINNVLSAHYSMTVPLVIDNSESLTYDIEANTQTVLLVADVDTKTLTVETQESEVVK